MKYILMSLVLVLGLFAVAKADNYGLQKTFTIGGIQVNRLIDTDNGNVCYVIIPSTNGFTPTISCVTGPLPIVTKK